MADWVRLDVTGADGERGDPDRDQASRGRAMAGGRAPRQLFRRFLDTTARVAITEQEVTVHLPRRAHNPILLDAGLFGAPAAIPWWDGRPLRIEIV